LRGRRGWGVWRWRGGGKLGLELRGSNPWFRRCRRRGGGDLLFPGWTGRWDLLRGRRDLYARQGVRLIEGGRRTFEGIGVVVGIERGWQIVREEGIVDEFVGRYIGRVRDELAMEMIEA
jgi:hypothetical protein